MVAWWVNKMCGIAGILGQKEATQDVANMLKKIAHRGPNGSGVHSIDDTAAIGMCRLRVRSQVDDAVPFPIDTETVAAYNGEIYGTIDDLAQPSATSPKGGADEVKTLLSCDAHTHADGMYATAIAHQDTVEVRRDPYGIKPLFYRETPHSILFCSEPLPLIHNPAQDINTDAFDDLLVFGHTLHNQTLYRSIHKLSVNERIQYQAGQHQRIQEAPPHYHRQKERPDVRALIAHSVQKCMLSDRPVGLSISSGLDSRILAHELNTQGYENLKTVSILIDDVDDGIKNLDQLNLPGAQSWRQWQHFSTQFQAADFPTYLEDSVLCLGQPTRMTSFPLYMKLAELTHQVGLTVLLSGEGADEIFYGYSDYLTWQPDLYADLPTALLKFYVSDTQHSLLQSILGPERVQASIARFNDFIAPFMIQGNPRKTLLKIEQALRLNALLERTDLCLMKYSIEGRVPYLHGGLPEQIALLPETDFIHSTQSKPLLRAAYANVLPTMNIPKKRFRMPIAKWLAEDCHDWAMDLIQSKDNGLSNIGIHQNQIEKWMQNPSPAVTTFTFTLLSYIIWHQHFVRGKTT